MSEALASRDFAGTGGHVHLSMKPLMKNHGEVGFSLINKNFNST
jgi:hypothetical protein